MKMRSRALTMLCLLATLLITKGSAGQRGSQAGGALCPGGLCSTTTPPAAPSPLGDGDITDLITSSMFDTMLPNRKYRPCHSDGFYTYDAFITAAKSFPTFATTGDTDTRKRELAAFFGQTSQQTSAAHPHGGPYVEGYCYVKQQNPKGDYCDQAFDDQWPCAPGKQYYGRGPIQLSYNYNYGQAGVALGLNRELLTTPDLVENESVVSFKTALWFWMTPQPPKPSCHDVITGNWIPTKEDISAGRFPGYGVITNIINSLECGHGQDASDEDRIGFYKRYCSDEIFDVRTGDNLDCKNQAPFGTVPALDSM